MRTVLILLGLVAFAAADGLSAMIRARADANELRMQGLQARLDTVEKKVGGLDNGVDTADLASRVDELTGTGCSDKEFQCGGNSPQCVNNLLVCDGSKDCRNGHDEMDCKDLDDLEGSSWGGRIHWDACGTLDNRITFVITGTDRPDYFQSRVWLKITFIMEEEIDGEIIHSSTNTDGFWNYGARRLVVYPGGPKRIGFTCDMNAGGRACTGEVMREGTLTHCGNVMLFRQ